ncbi:Adaptive-response sensory-kinase SasA [subsurface metagenome]
MNARFLGEGLPGVFVLAESGEQADDSVRIAGVGYSEFKQSAEAAISEISAGTARIDHIVRELKSFVGGEVKGSIEPTDVNQVIRTVVDLSRHLIRKATGYFALNLNQALPRVEADRIRLEQVVLNLVQNACQSLPDRNRSVTVSTRHDRTSNTVLIEVADQGIGIPEADLDLVSDPFFTTRRSVGGTGLGLSVSSRIVRDHGGTLSFRSQVGRGTTAVVSLPACNV